MNIKRAVMTAALAVTLAITATVPVSAQNTSETGHGTRTTRSGEAVTNSTRVRGEMESLYVDFTTGDFVGFLRIDMESTFAADYMLTMMKDPDLMDSELDLDIEGSFRVRGMGECAGLYGSDSGMDLFIIYCVDGTYGNMVMATDKKVALDVMEGVQMDGELVLPRGYTEYEEPQ